MATLMQDFGIFYGLHIWVDMEDDSLQVTDQTRLFVYIKNRNKKVVVGNVLVKVSIQAKGPTVLPDSIEIKKIVPGRTIKETLTINVGDVKKAKYEIGMVANFQLIPGTWELEPLPFNVQ